MTSLTVDPVALVERFGVAFGVLAFVAWMIVKLANGVLPKIADACVERIKAGTELTRETKSVVTKIPEVIAQSGKETREAISSFEKAMIASEARIVSAFQTAVTNLQGEIFDHKQERIDKTLGKIAQRAGSIPDSDAPPAPDAPLSRRSV